MTKYVQKPTGWWQDDEDRAQPPGSFLDPSLRLRDKVLERTTERSSTTRVRRFVAVRRHFAFSGGDTGTTS